MTSLGEAALGRLIIRFTDYRTLLESSEMRAGEHRGRHIRDADGARHHNALTDLVAVLESFTTVRLLNLRPTVPNKDVMNWVGRIKMWKKHGGVDLTTFPETQAILGFVQVRNALEHGIGRLTERQLGEHRDQILTQIAAAGVHLNGDLLSVTPNDVSRCLDVGERFVHFLDRKAPAV